MTGIQTLGSNKTISHWSQDDVRTFLASHFLTRKYRPNLSHWTGSELVGAGDENLASLGVPYLPRKYLLRKVQALSVAETAARFPEREPKLRALVSNPHSYSVHAQKKSTSFASSSSSSSSSSTTLSETFAPPSPSTKKRMTEKLQKVKEKFSASSSSPSSARSAFEKEGSETVFSLRRFQRVEIRLNATNSGSAIGSGRGSPPSKRHRHSQEQTSPQHHQHHQHQQHLIEQEEEELQANKEFLQHFLQGNNPQLDLSGLYDYINQGANDRRTPNDLDNQLCTFSYYAEEDAQSGRRRSGQRKRKSGEGVEEKLALASLSTPEELCLWFEQENIAEAVPYLLKNRVTLAQLQVADRAKLRSLLPMPEPKWRRLEFLLWSELQPYDAPRSRRIIQMS